MDLLCLLPKSTWMMHSWHLPCSVCVSSTPHNSLSQTLPLEMVFMSRKVTLPVESPSCRVYLNGCFKPWRCLWAEQRHGADRAVFAQNLLLGLAAISRERRLVLCSLGIEEASSQCATIPCLKSSSGAAVSEAGQLRGAHLQHLLCGVGCSSATALISPSFWSMTQLWTQPFLPSP